MELPNEDLEVSVELSGSKKKSIFAQKREKLAQKKRMSKKNNLNVLYPPEIDLTLLLDHYNTGRHGPALNLAQAMTRRFPKFSMGWQILAALFQQTGNLDDALSADQKAAELSPQDPMVHKTLGNTYFQLCLFTKAIKSYKRCLSLAPQLAEVHYNLGTSLLKLDKPTSAEQSLKKAISLNSTYIEAFYNLADCQKSLCNHTEAEINFKKVLTLKPDFADAHNNFGNMLFELGRTAEAKFHLEQAIALIQEFPEAYHNLGMVFAAEKQHSKAKEYYQKALQINPNLIDVHWSLSLCQLTLSEFNIGFESYEIRYHPALKVPITLYPNLSATHFKRGNIFRDLKNKHLLICPEQGLGDEVMFASMINDLLPLVKQNKNTQITLAADSRLVSLFTRSFKVLNIIPIDSNDCYQEMTEKPDHWLFNGSLSAFLRKSIKDFNQHRPYLIADKILLCKWDERLKALPRKMNIGISWLGGSKVKNKLDRSMSLEAMLPIMETANHYANFINLQYGDHREEISNFTRNTGITLYDWEDCDPIQDLENFSAQIKALDLVISIDNSTVHFAGALGTKTYVMLPFDQDWRWGEKTTKSHWYPDIVTLFRQRQPNDWEEVIKNVARAMNEDKS